MCESLLLNPTLISMPSEESHRHVAHITQALAHAEECARRQIETPFSLLKLEGMNKRGSREMMEGRGLG